MEKLYPEIKTELPGPKGSEIVKKDLAYSSPSYIKAYNLVVSHGEGAWVYDVDGNRFLDFMAGIAVNSTGYSHPKVVAAVKDAADKFFHICGTDFFYPAMADVCERIANFVPKMGKKKVFLTNSGGEAVEGAIKLARYHTKRSALISFKGSFHGRTTGCITLTTSKTKYRAHFGPLLPGVYHTDYCDPYRDANETEKNSPAIKKLEEMFATLVSPKEVAAIFVEPVLGEGGYITPTKFFMHELRRICDEHGIMLVFDEVQSGNGRTGYMFASEMHDVYPDIYTTAKGIASGMPLGAIVAKEEVMTWPRGSHGSTYGGNPLACAAALATYDVIEPLLPTVRELGKYMIGKLNDLKAKYHVIGDVRGSGFMVGVEFVDPTNLAPAAAFMEDFEQLGFKKGVLFLGCGTSTIRLAPPLIVTQHEIDVMLGVMEECLKELSEKYGY